MMSDSKGENHSLDEKLSAGEHEPPRRDSRASRRNSSTAKLLNPLAGVPEAKLLSDVEDFCHEKGFTEQVETFQKGALVAQVQHQEYGFEHVKKLSEEDKEVLRYEMAHKWHQPFRLYFLVVLCAGSAIVQGMDQTAVNGAQL